MDNFMQNFEYFRQYYFSDAFVMRVVIPGLLFILMLVLIKMVLNWAFRINTRIRELKKINSNLEELSESMQKIISQNEEMAKRLSQMEKNTISSINSVKTVKSSEDKKTENIADAVIIETEDKSGVQ